MRRPRSDRRTSCRRSRASTSAALGAKRAVTLRCRFVSLDLLASAADRLRVRLRASTYLPSVP